MIFSKCQILRILVSVVFHAFALKLPSQTLLSVVPTQSVFFRTTRFQENEHILYNRTLVLQYEGSITEGKMKRQSGPPRGGWFDWLGGGTKAKAGKGRFTTTGMPRGFHRAGGRLPGFNLGSSRPWPNAGHNTEGGNKRQLLAFTTTGRPTGSHRIVVPTGRPAGFHRVPAVTTGRPSVSVGRFRGFSGNQWV